MFLSILYIHRFLAPDHEYNKETRSLSYSVRAWYPLYTDWLCVTGLCEPEGKETEKQHHKEDKETW